MLCRAGKLDAALAIQHGMKASGMAPDIMTVNIMMTDCARLINWMRLVLSFTAWIVKFVAQTNTHFVP